MSNYRRRRWRDANTVRLDLNGLLTGAVGPDGVSPEELVGLEDELGRVREELATARAAGLLSFAELPHRHAELERVLEVAAAVRERFDTVVVLGTGGSALGARALAGALADGADGCRIVVADTVDPESFAALLGGLDLRRTVFNVISKSGDTAETMAQFLIVRDRLLRELGAVDYKDHLVVTTDARQGAMRQIVNDEGFRDLPIPTGVGGRFTVLSPVGLFPAAAAGIDVAAVLAGAAQVDERQQAATSPLTDPALMLGGALWLLAARRGKTIVVLMPYCERLAGFGDWFCQLWAESLGRARDLAGRTVEWGQTPLVALGTAARHAQLQLFLEGPRDKVLVFLRVEDHGATLDIPATYQDIENLAYLGGRSLAALLHAEQRATALALAGRGRPSATLALPALNAFTMGQLLYLFEMGAVCAGALAGVDPFGQPAVEEGKRWASALMGRPGFEAERAQAEAWLGRREDRFVL